jgi:DNA/RNA endonuclease YhcR with UshA esterase domain
MWRGNVGAGRRLLKCGALLLCVLIATSAGAQEPKEELKKYTAAEAKEHIGETAIVCGKVASASFADNIRGTPTFLNLEKPHPSQIFTVVIWGRFREKFDKPEVKYKGKEICVRGKISEFRGVPQIEAREPAQFEEAKK